MEMKVDAKTIRLERERRAWSQEHLAGVSGLGLRTIQRIESNATASYESIKAIAAALNLLAGDLLVRTQPALAETESSLVESAHGEDATEKSNRSPESQPEGQSDAPSRISRSPLQKKLPPIVLASGMLIGAAATLPVFDFYWWIGPLIVSVAALAARKTKNLIESRGHAGMLRAFTLALSFLLACAIMATVDPKFVPLMIPILGGGLIAAITDIGKSGKRLAAC